MLAKSSCPRSWPDAELAVVGTLGDRLLEHHHRGHSVRLAQVGDVEALDPHRQRLQVEVLAQLLQRLDAAGARALRDQPVVLERHLGIAPGQLDQPPLLAPLRDPHLDRRRPPLGQVQRQQVGVLKARRQEHLARDRDLAAVVLDREPPQHVRLALAAGVVQVEAAPVGQPPVAELEQLDVGGVLGDGHGRAHRRSASRRDRPPDARPGGGRRSAGCGSGRPPRTRARPRPASSAPPAAARADARGRTGTRSRPRSPPGSPPARSAPRRAPHSGRCGSPGRARPSGGPAPGPRRGGTGRRGSARPASRAPCGARVGAEVQHALAVPLAGEHHARVLVATVTAM